MVVGKLGGILVKIAPLVKRVCKECDVDVSGICSDVKCSGQPYHSINVLTCESHALAYEIECSERAKAADQVIDRELGKATLICQSHLLVS